MKKTIYFILVLLTMSLVFISCKKDADDSTGNYEILTANDIDDSWLSGTWSGTEENIIEGDNDLMLQFDSKTPSEVFSNSTYPIKNVTITASELKNLLNSLNATWTKNGLSMVSTITIKANHERTTFIREINQSITNNDKSFTHIEICTYNKD